MKHFFFLIEARKNRHKGYKSKNYNNNKVENNKNNKPLLPFSSSMTMKIMTMMMITSKILHQPTLPLSLSSSLMPRIYCQAFSTGWINAGTARTRTGRIRLRRNSIYNYHYESGLIIINDSRLYLSSSSTTTTTTSASNSDDTNDGSTDSTTTNLPEPMENIYTSWSLEQDQTLWENYNEEQKPIPEIASILGRGLGGVKARLNKLQDVSSYAYQRLFVIENQNQDKKKSNQKGNDVSTDDEENKSTKLVPAGEVLRRIQWDYMLQESDFFILYYDRLDDKVITSSLTAPNDSINGSEQSLIKALPEHRIVGIQYKERLVWDRATKLDLVFNSGVSGKSNKKDDDDRADSNESKGIYHIIETYDEWKKQKDQIMEWNLQRQQIVTKRIYTILGKERYEQLQNLSNKLHDEVEGDIFEGESLTSTSTSSASSDLIINAKTIETYVTDALQLFRERRRNGNDSENNTEGKLESESILPTDERIEKNDDDDDVDDSVVLIPQTDYMALDELSELVATLPNHDVRTALLTEITQRMDRINGKSDSTDVGNVGDNDDDDDDNNGQQKTSITKLNEDDIIETFIRGSGPGGQKINKTSNRVVLVHKHTNVRIECQQTRSLQINRKIARKKLIEKLDEYYNGTKSKISMKQKKMSQKKIKSKLKNRSRQNKKRQEKEERQKEKDEEEDDDDDDEERNDENN